MDYKTAKIKSLIESDGRTIKEWAVSNQIPYTTIRNVLKRGWDSSSMKTLQKICSALGTTISAIEDIDNTNKINSFDILPISKQKFPLLGNIACGKPIMANEDLESYVEIGTQINADFCLKTVGNSMINARIHDSDIVFIKKQSMVNNGEIAAVIINNETTLKRVYYYPERNKLVLNAENPKYEPLVYVGQELESIRILGRAVAFQSDVK